MATNFVQPGKTVTMTAPSGGVTSGVGVLIGNLFGIALETVAQTLPFEMAIEGVFTIAKVASLAVSPGDVLYWNTSTKDVDKTASSKKVAGIAVSTAGVGAGVVTIDILLIPVVRIQVGV